MQHDTPATLRQAITQALEAAPQPLRVQHIDLFKEPAVMVGDAESGAVLITGALDEACTDTLEILACRYPVGYDPADPRQDLPEDAATVYETMPGDPLDRAENLARLVEAITGPTAPARRPVPDLLFTPAQRTADAYALARALHLTTNEVTARHLDEIARSVYARAAVWYGEDAAVLADDAEALFEEERDEDDQDQYTEPTASVRFVEAAREQLARSGRPATEPAGAHEAGRLRALCLEILASLMHAQQVIEGSHYDICDAHEPFADLERPLVH